MCTATLFMPELCTYRGSGELNVSRTDKAANGHICMMVVRTPPIYTPSQFNCLDGVIGSLEQF